MVSRGLAGSRERAAAAIESGRVTIGGTPAIKANRLVAASEPILVHGPRPRYVSRGGHKLEAALMAFDLDVAGKRCLDAGASTGGFTDCLCQHGAASVLALDVGRGQLHEGLRHDQRVTCRERTNLRTVRLSDLASEAFEVLVADLSFISLRSVAGVLLGELAGPGADVVVLIKPQFETGDRRALSRGRGVLREPALWLGALEAVVEAFESCGAGMMGVMESPITGADGNVEFLLYCRAHGGGGARLDLPGAVEAVLGRRSQE